MKKFYVIGAVLLSAFYANTVLALGNIKIDGFMSYVVTRGFNDANTPYDNGVATKEPGTDTRENRLGLQFSAQVDADTDITAQLIARGGQFDYNVTTDWAYINYKPSANWKIHVGKYKVAEFLVSDYADVGYAYPWVRPPQDVYSTNPLISLAGVDVLYKKPLGEMNLLAQVYFGSGTHQTFIPARTIDLSNGRFVNDKGSLINFSTDDNLGFNIGVASSVYTLRLGYFSTRVEVPKLVEDAWGSFGGLGFSMDLNDFVTYAELISRDTAAKLETAFPDQFAGYITFGYRSEKYLPYVTYSRIDAGVDKSEFALKEYSTALGVRYEVSNASTIKFEAMRVVPKKGNHGLFYEPVADGVVLSASYDVIF